MHVILVGECNSLPPVPQQHRGAVKLEAIAVGQNQRTVLALCDFVNRMRPVGHQFGWSLFVNTIGRSDNIDDVLLSNIDIENDAITFAFSNTKSRGNQQQEKTGICKPFFA